MADTPHAIILAAGAGARFGGLKPLAQWRKTTLLGQIIITARMVCGDNVIVVTGAHAEALAPHLAGVRTVHNADWAGGMGGSLACGSAALPADASAALILPVDQPLITAAHCLALLAAARAQDQAVLTGDGTRIGPPAALPARLFPLARTLSGERGLKALLPPAGIAVIVDPDALRDADTPAALQALKESLCGF